MGNAWILDLKSRRVVWELSAAATERGRRSTRVFNGTVRLPAGTYEAFYSAFPTSTGATTRATPTRAQRFHELARRRGLRRVPADRSRQRAGRSPAPTPSARGTSSRTARSSTCAATAARNSCRPASASSRPTELDIYAEGEAREDNEFDTGWIVNADTHEKIWKLTWRDSAAAGGAEKNRMAHISKTLPAGRYAAFYATDDSHDPEPVELRAAARSARLGLRVRCSADAGARAPRSRPSPTSTSRRRHDRRADQGRRPRVARRAASR